VYGDFVVFVVVVFVVVAVVVVVVFVVVVVVVVLCTYLFIRFLCSNSQVFDVNPTTSATSSSSRKSTANHKAVAKPTASADSMSLGWYASPHPSFVFIDIF
jgi:hypothetical protein